ncbi:MAG: hypothetical protein NT126_09535 [Bacteroidetes bacterium]|nr:hypothetical protein [Bacteroidota bacterium]
MKNILLAAIILLRFTVPVLANDKAKDRQELQHLLEERQQMFDRYSGSLSDHSGIFGNRTKKDILKSNDVLIGLVRTDNNIIRVLNRVVDFRNFEKATMNYDLQNRDEELENSRHAADTLAKQLDSAIPELTILRRKVNRDHAVITFLILSLATSLFFLWRKKAG